MDNYNQVDCLVYALDDVWVVDSHIYLVYIDLGAVAYAMAVVDCDDSVHVESLLVANIWLVMSKNYHYFDEL